MRIEKTTFTDTDERTYPALYLSHDTVKSILGRYHEGTPEDDETILAYLYHHGYGAWHHCPGSVDEAGFYLIDTPKGGR